jgi:hypothetical protein
MAEETFMVVIQTSDGVYTRLIRPAKVLPDDGRRGRAAEDATRGAAATFGVPDFVFRPARSVRGSGSREVGDAVIVVGPRAASVQVKTRSAPSGDEIRERSWLTKQIEHGTRQARGTIRDLTSRSKTVLVNERGRTIAIAGNDKTWLPVVVVDHPGVEDYVPRGEAVVLLRRDWEFLFEQLKSTYAVMEYLFRVRGEHVALGQEPIRYYEFAAADAATPPSEVDPRLAALGFRAESLPVLPMPPAGHGDDVSPHMLFRVVQEDIALSPMIESGMSESDRLDVLAAIDAAPVAYRADLGRLIVEWLRDVADSADEVKWRFRSHTWPDRPYLVFGTATHHNELIQEGFFAYVRLRHQQHLDLTPERVGLMTVGVLLTPRQDDLRPWDTTLGAVEGDQGFSVEERAGLEGLWGKMGEGVIHKDAEATAAALVGTGLFERRND